MSKHLGHLAMCAPMFVIAGVAIAAGASVAFLVPALMCLAMMMMMHGGHGGHGPHEHGDKPR